MDHRNTETTMHTALDLCHAVGVLGLLLFLPACASAPRVDAGKEAPTPSSPMELGAFSVSLSVKDLAASRAFYETLGFRSVMGEPAQNWLILRNGNTTIGLFQGLFEGNILTFNPGWSPLAEPLPKFEDVRSLATRLEAAGIELSTRPDPQSKGPASFVLVDPDGNTILVDQHVD